MATILRGAPALPSSGVPSHRPRVRGWAAAASSPAGGTGAVERGDALPGGTPAAGLGGGAFGRGVSKCDVVLSSGFLSFANHSGFLRAVDEAGFSVQGVMGTSAGALAGSLFAAGYSPVEVVELLCEKPPLNYLRPSRDPCKGILDMRGVVARLSQLLPPTFEDLAIPFAVGVIDSDGHYVLVDSGPLAEAVTASAAIPVLFRAVDIPSTGGGAALEGRGPFRDGGKVDRVGVRPWREKRRAGGGVGGGEGPHPVLAHVVARSSPFSGDDDAAGWGEQGVLVVNCPKSGRSLGSLGSHWEDYDAAYRRAGEQIKAAGVGGTTLAFPPRR